MRDHNKSTQSDIYSSTQSSILHRLPPELRMLIWKYVLSATQAIIVSVRGRSSFCSSTSKHKPPKYYPHPLHYACSQFIGEIAEQFCSHTLVVKDYFNPSPRWSETEVPLRMMTKLQRLRLDARELTAQFSSLHLQWPAARTGSEESSVNRGHLVTLTKVPHFKHLEVRWIQTVSVSLSSANGS